MGKEIINSLNWRYAVQTFDSSKKISSDDFNVILESGRLAPSSYGFEPWKFLVIENPEIRAKLREAGYGQPKITDASHLIVLARRTDARKNIVNERIARTAEIYGTDKESLKGFQDMMEGAVNSYSDEYLDADMKAQVFIPLGIMITTASMMKIDSAPMGGFDAKKFDEILGLKEKNLTATVLLALGYRGQDEAAKRPKVRRAFDEVVEFIK